MALSLSSPSCPSAVLQVAARPFRVSCPRALPHPAHPGCRQPTTHGKRYWRDGRLSCVPPCTTCLLQGPRRISSHPGSRWLIGRHHRRTCIRTAHSRTLPVYSDEAVKSSGSCAVRPTGHPGQPCQPPAYKSPRSHPARSCLRSDLYSTQLYGRGWIGWQVGSKLSRRAFAEAGEPSFLVTVHLAPGRLGAKALQRARDRHGLSTG